MRASSLHTLEQTAILLGWSTHTVRSYAKIAGIVPASSGHYRGRTLYSEADIDLLRRTRAERDPHSVTTPPATTDTRALEARVAALEQQVAALLSRYTGNLTPPIHSTVYEPPRRASASTVRHARTPARPPLPAHLMSIPTWVERHGVRQGTVKTWRERRYLPVERGQWLEAGVRIDTALTLEGREIAHQLAHLPWPCEVCAGEGEENETTPTHAVVEVARHDVVEE